MDIDKDNGVKLVEHPLTVDIVGDEIVVDGFAGNSPSLTAGAARETARRLIEAADTLQRRKAR